MSVNERAVEWVRDHGGGGIVDSVENWWFTRHGPARGGQPDRPVGFDVPVPGTDTGPTRFDVPRRRVGRNRSSDGPTHTPRPADIASVAAVPLANEGMWQPVGATVNGIPAMYATQVRPDDVHTSLLDGLAWIDPKLARFELHPGLQVPGGTWSTPRQVASEQRVGLLAAFNGGFRMDAAKGGFYLEGRAEPALRDGAASFVILADGTATVGQWGRDATMTADTVAVRQNLSLILDAGLPVPGLPENVDGKWGATLGNKVLVWRSAVCVDANGGIIFGYGDGLGVLSLAQLMQRAGCIRAMELDINPSWTTFNIYAAATPGDPTSVSGHPLLPDQRKPGSRYLRNDSRDFFAVLSREHLTP